MHGKSWPGKYTENTNKYSLSNIECHGADPVLLRISPRVVSRMVLEQLFRIIALNRWRYAGGVCSRKWHLARMAPPAEAAPPLLGP